MVQDLYKGGEYMDELDNFENVTDTLLQLVMDDGNALLLIAVLVD